MGLFGKWSRRDLLKSSGAVAGAAVAPLAAGAPAPRRDAHAGHTGHETDNLFTRIGVRPLINGRGTYTIITGSRSLPEVKQAMFEASHYYVQMDEMMDGIGARAGPADRRGMGHRHQWLRAAICLATIACIAGANVEKCQALPYIKAKDQVIIPKHSRNPYDLGVRMVGAEIVEVETPDELRRQDLAPHRHDLCHVAPARPKRRAADPRHLRHRQGKEHAGVRGCGGGRAAQSQYPSGSGRHLGRLFRRQMPARAAILRHAAGQQELCKAAYFQAAPHHCYGRALKCSKEETMGLLAAVRHGTSATMPPNSACGAAGCRPSKTRLKPLPVHQFRISGAGRSFQQGDAAAHRMGRQCAGHHRHRTGRQAGCRHAAHPDRAGTGRRPDQMASTSPSCPT